MPHPIGRKVADKIAIQLIEANVEIGFALVDEAKAYHALCKPELRARALRDAEEVVADIERRLERLSGSESGPFHPLLIEIRNEIAAEQRKTS